MTRADELAAKADGIARDVERIQALSRIQPHIFAEQKDDLACRARALAAEIRTSFGGTPVRLVPGIIADRRGRPVRVETRRRVAL